MNIIRSKSGKFFVRTPAIYDKLYTPEGMLSKRVHVKRVKNSMNNEKNEKNKNNSMSMRDKSNRTTILAIQTELSMYR